MPQTDERSGLRSEDTTRPKPLVTVHDAFEDYVRGDQITDPAEAKRVLEAYPFFVTKLA